MFTTWLRGIAVWLLLMAAEVVHGIARTICLVPIVGDFRARQIGVFTGSLLIVLITSLLIRWIGAGTLPARIAVGVTWVAFTLVFEIAFGRYLLGYSWGRLASDYNLIEGGLLPIGLAVMAMSPWIASRLRGAPACT